MTGAASGRGVTDEGVRPMSDRWRWTIMGDGVDELQEVIDKDDFRNR